MKFQAYRYVFLVFLFSLSLVSASTCFDSDGGQVLSIKGQVQGQYSNGVSFTITDTCSPNNPQSISEAYCVGVDSSSKWFSCPSGQTCSNGACVVSQQQYASCSDSDGGQNLQVAGTVTGRYSNGNSFILTDTCSSNNPSQVSEAYCVGQDPSSSWKQCLSGQICSAGKCVTSSNNPTNPSSQAICSDTDGGDNIFTKGYVSGKYSNGQSFGSYDFCSLTDASKVSEGVCLDANGDGIKESISTSWKQCLIGQVCQDGACVVKSAGTSCSASGGTCQSICSQGSANIGVLSCGSGENCCKVGAKLIDCPAGTTTPSCSADGLSYTKCNSATGVTEKFTCDSGRTCNPSTGLCQSNSVGDFVGNVIPDVGGIVGDQVGKTLGSAIKSFFSGLGTLGITVFVVVVVVIILIYVGPVIARFV